MKKIKKYNSFINELKSSTWKNAADKAKELGQVNLSNKFKDKFFKSIEDEIAINRDRHRETFLKKHKNYIKGNLALQIIYDLEFDYYVHSYYAGEDAEEFEYGKVCKTKINDHYLWDEEYYSFLTSYEDLDYSNIRRKYMEEDWEDLDPVTYFAYDSNILSKIDIMPTSPYIKEAFHPKNKFANRKSAIKFINMLKKLYILGDYNKRNKIIAKMNKSNVSDIKNSAFKRFIDNEFGSWDEFQSKLNIRELYDVY